MLPACPTCQRDLGGILWGVLSALGGNPGTGACPAGYTYQNTVLVLIPLCCCDPRKHAFLRGFRI